MPGLNERDVNIDMRSRVAGARSCTLGLILRRGDGEDTCVDDEETQLEIVNRLLIGACYSLVRCFGLRDESTDRIAAGAAKGLPWWVKYEESQEMDQR